MHAPKQSKDFNLLKRFYTCFNTAALVSAIFQPQVTFLKQKDFVSHAT